MCSLQGLAFLPKTECNVRNVEVAVALMLTKSTIEPVVFRVPRVKVSQWTQASHLPSFYVYEELKLCIFGPQKEFFQDDVYSDTAVCWEPALTGSAWLSGSNGQHRKISLKPKDMTPGADTDQFTGHVAPAVCVSGINPVRTLCLISVSEAPKEAPVRKYLPSSVYLEEKTDEQKKDEVRMRKPLMLWLLHEGRTFF